MILRNRNSDIGQSARQLGRFLLSAAAQTYFGSCFLVQFEAALLVAPALLGVSAIRPQQCLVFVRNAFRF